MTTANKGTHLGGSPDHPSRTVPNGFDPAQSDMWRHRRLRERRKQAQRRRLKHLSKHVREVEDILAFACLWAPFGGVPEEETFIKFGMRPRRFLERLWQSVAETPCDKAEIDLLRWAYPPVTAAVSDPDPSVSMTIDDRTRPGGAL